jgi:poly-gamma-glutamate synthesis protein (capsule biosynthesis protein)
MQRFFQKISLTILTIVMTVTVPGSASGGSGPAMYVVLLGDYLPGASAAQVIRIKGYSYMFDGIRPYTEGVDTLFLNLETPLSGRGSAVEEKSYTFRSSPKVARVLKEEGVRAVNLANNHILDYGVDALTDTIKYLSESNVATAGAGINWQQAARAALVKTPVGTIRFVAFSNTLPKSYWAKRDRPGTLFGSEKAVRIAISKHRGTGPVVASFHWGAELMTEPKEYQESLARVAIDSGATLVVGHHPHVPQPIDVYKGVPILYSLGNFAFGSYSKKAPYGLMAKAEFDEDGRCTMLEVYPLNTDNTRVAFSPRPVTGLEGKRVFDSLVKGIDLSQASVLWDGEKGVVVPKEVNEQ